MNLFGKTWEDRFNEGMKFGSADDFPKAIESFRKAISLAPTQPYPHYELGYTLFLMEQYQEALSELRKTNELQPGFFLVQTEIYLCEAILSGKIDKVGLALFRHLQHLTDEGQVHNEETISLSQKAVEMFPQVALSYFYYGKGLFGIEDDEAVRNLLKCLELNPDETTAIDAKQHIAIYQANVGNIERVTCSHKTTPRRRRESTKINIGDSSNEKDIYGRTDRRNCVRL